MVTLTSLTDSIDQLVMSNSLGWASILDDSTHFLVLSWMCIRSRLPMLFHATTSYAAISIVTSLVIGYITAHRSTFEVL
jgi:hypothetical protein